MSRPKLRLLPPKVVAYFFSRHYSTFTQAFDLRGAGFAGDTFFTTTDYNAFVQDTWRVNNLLTLNVGLRWEHQRFPQPGGTDVRGVAFTGNPAYGRASLDSVASSSYDAAPNKATVNLTEVVDFGASTSASNTLFGPRDMQFGIKFTWSNP